MAKQFRGTIDVDIRDSVPDWAPFEPPKRSGRCGQRGLHRARRRWLLGDELLRRADRDAEHRPHRRRWRALHAMAHDGAVLADPFVPVDRAQPHTQLDGLHHRGRGRVPECEWNHSAGERHAPGDSRRGGLEHLHGRQVALVPDHRDERRLDAAQLAFRPRVRALVRVPGRRDQPVVSGPRLRQPSRRPAEVTGGGLSPHRGPHRQGAGIHQGREGARAGQAVLPVLRAGCGARAAPRAEGLDRQVQGPLRHGLRGAARADPGPADRDGDRPGRHRAAPHQPDRHAGDPHGSRRASRSRRWTSPGRGIRCPRTRSGCSAGWPRCTRDSWRTPTIRSAGCWTTWRTPGSGRTR